MYSAEHYVLTYLFRTHFNVEVNMHLNDIERNASYKHYIYLFNTTGEAVTFFMLRLFMLTYT